MVDGTLTRYAFLHPKRDFKTPQMDVQCSLIRELMLFAFELGSNPMDPTKSIFCEKGEKAVILLPSNQMV